MTSAELMKYTELEATRLGLRQTQVWYRQRFVKCPFNRNRWRPNRGTLSTASDVHSDRVPDSRDLRQQRGPGHPTRVVDGQSTKTSPHPPHRPGDGGVGSHKEVAGAGARDRHSTGDGGSGVRETSTRNPVPTPGPGNLRPDSRPERLADGKTPGKVPPSKPASGTGAAVRKQGGADK